jgi:surfactin synthase thioesterase subunit
VTDRLTLFCFACAGASAAPYQRWHRSVPSWLHVVPVERPGRGRRYREPHLRDFSSLVGALTQELVTSLPRRYALFGHSLGGLLAFACAHEIRRLALHPPLAVCVAGSAAPSHRDDSRFRSLQSDQAVEQELRRQNGTPEEVYGDAELRRMTLDAAAADFAACSSFRHRPVSPLTMPFFVFGGDKDEIARDAFHAWTTETTANTTFDIFDGGHFFLRERETAFLEKLVERLADLQSPLCLPATAVPERGI